MATEQAAQGGMHYLDMQAYVGITKHNGGFDATNELLSFCRIEGARQVLNVGCGIGVGSTYVARKYGCHVAGVDISEKMVEWSRRRAREERVEDKVEFRVADVLELPFEADRFDVVFANPCLHSWRISGERFGNVCGYQTRGYVGLNETFWIQEPAPEMIARVRGAVGSAIPTIENLAVALGGVWVAGSGGENLPD